MYIKFFNSVLLYFYCNIQFIIEVILNQETKDFNVKYGAYILGFLYNVISQSQEIFISAKKRNVNNRTIQMHQNPSTST